MADVIFNCYANNYAGVPIFTTSIEGVLLDSTYTLGDLELVLVTSISGGNVSSAFPTASQLTFATSIAGSGVSNVGRTNWVGWSKIGEANFVLDLVNDAGFRPMSWPGYVYQVLKLGKNAVVYGSGGVTMMMPVGSPYPTFGFKELLTTGVKNKQAVAGDEFVHFFIDDLGCLYKVSEGLEVLGYEEFLLPMTNPLMIWDAGERRLYISDGTVGYVYNDSALTGGFANLTGLYRLNNSMYAISGAAVTVEPVSLVTDVLDFKYRGLKSIEAIQFDVDASGPLYAAVDYRYRKDRSFKTTRWTALNSAGIAHLRTTGTEFRIRLKSLVRLNFELSYLSIQYKFIDRRFSRGPIGDTGEVNAN